MSQPQAVAELARAALEQGTEKQAIPAVTVAARRFSDASLWQWAGLLNRSIDEHETALECFTTAARLAPADAKIAQGLAHVALEAGVDAIAPFERARGLAPGDPAVLIGLTAARMAAGEGDTAIAELEAALQAAPHWLAGHLQLAQLRSLTGQAGEAPASLEQAIRRDPRQPMLWLALCELQLRSEAYEQLWQTVERAKAAGASSIQFTFYRAVAAGELGDPGAEQLLSTEVVGTMPALAIWRIRFLIRTGQVAAALDLIDRELNSDRRESVWPYATIAWRLADDPRARWLEDSPGLVTHVDIEGELLPIEPLVSKLRSLHERSGQFMDQSVRGGSQTDGPLLSRIDPDIRRLRRAVVTAVGRYIAELPPPEAGHPLLRHPRDRRIRFSGSWSVRLSGGGRHASHVHPQGWISSALYLALPRQRTGDPPDAGWLVLGEPPESLGVELPPHTKIEPRVGRLALFPSWMWHGTRPFATGERLTVAFDVAAPIPPSLSR